MKKFLSTLLIFLISGQLLFSQANPADGTLVDNKPSGGTITLGTGSRFNVNQSSANQTLLVPNPVNAVKEIEIRNTGSTAFTLSPGGSVGVGKGVKLSWTGLAWSVIGTGTVTSGGDASLTQSVTNGDQTHAPSGDAVYDFVQAVQSDIETAIDLKVDKSGSKVLTDVNFSAGDKSKLDAIAAGATANDTDANLKARSNHTGTQPYTTITGLGDAAIKNTGTSAGTLAAGDDSRFTAINANTQAALDLKASKVTRETMVDANKTFTAGVTEVYTTVALTAPRTLTLPLASSVPAGEQRIFVDEFGALSATNYVTITRAGSDLINGATTLVNYAQYGVIRLISDGVSKWTTTQLVSYNKGTWIPTWVGFSVNPVSTTYYALVDDICFVWLNVSTAGTSSQASTTVTLPFVSLNDVSAATMVLDNNVRKNGAVFVAAGSNVLNIYSTVASGAMTASGGKGVFLTGFSFKIQQ